MLKIKQQKDNLELVVNKRAIKIIMLLHYTINEQYKGIVEKTWMLPSCHYPFVHEINFLYTEDLNVDCITWPTSVIVND